MAQIKADEITKLIREQIDNYETKIAVDEVGTVMSVGDGIARVYGLEKVMAGELLAFPHNVAGLAMNLEEDQVGTVLLGDYTEIQEGDEVKRTGKIMSVPVGDAMIGRVVNGLGQSHRRQGPRRDRQVQSGGAPRARRHRSSAGEGTYGHGTEGHRLHDSDRTWPARAHHRRPPDRQDRSCARRDHQQQRTRPDLHLLRHRPEAVVGCASGEDAGRLRRDGIHHRSFRLGFRSRPDAVHRALCRVRHRRVLPR